MVAHVLAEPVGVGDQLHDGRPAHRVRADDPHLLCGQGGGLVEDAVGYEELAHVVHPRREDDVVQFLAGVSADQIWFRRPTGTNNLEVQIIGRTEKVTIKDWYLGSAYHVEQFKTADGAKTLLDSSVENLVSAMAAFAPPASGQTSLPAAYQSALASVIASNWQ